MNKLKETQMIDFDKYNPIWHRIEYIAGQCNYLEGLITKLDERLNMLEIMNEAHAERLKKAQEKLRDIDDIFSNIVGC